jgi:hypothetical protein
MDNPYGYFIVRLNETGYPTQVYWAETKDSRITGGYPYTAYDATQDYGYYYLTDFNVSWND